MGLREYGAACALFERSREACGEHHVTHHNIGLCNFYLARFDAAAAAFAASLDLAPDYKDAAAWLEKATAAAGEAAAAAAAAAEAAATPHV